MIMDNMCPSQTTTSSTNPVTAEPAAPQGPLIMGLGAGTATDLPDNGIIGGGGQTPPGTRRPLVPPKPKKSFSGIPKPLLESPVSPGIEPSSPGRKSTVGTQVNLLGKNSTPSSSTPRIRKSNICDSNTNTPKKSSNLQTPLSPSQGGLTKPVLPPKPSPSSLPPQHHQQLPIPNSRSRRESIEKPFTSPQHSNKNHNSSSPSSPNISNTTTNNNHKHISEEDAILNIYASIDEINSSPQTKSIKPPQVQSQTQSGVGIVGLGSISVAKRVFQFPITSNPNCLPGKNPSSFIPLSSQSKIAAQRKSTSLGRNNNFSPFTKSPNNTSPLNLHMSSNLSDIKSISSIPQSIFDNPEKSNSLPPYPPPRARRASLNKLPTTPTGTLGSMSLPLSPTSPIPNQISPQSAPPSIINPPIYAVVDKEKKWQDRKQKVEGQPETSTGTEIDASDGNANRPKSPGVVEASSPSPSTPSPKGWLSKFILPSSSKKTKEPVITESTSTPTTPQSSTFDENDSFLFNYSITSTNSTFSNEDGGTQTIMDLNYNPNLNLNLKNENLTDDDLTPTLENPQGFKTSTPTASNQEIDFEALVDKQLESINTIDMESIDGTGDVLKNQRQNGDGDGDIVSQIVLSQQQFKDITRAITQEKVPRRSLEKSSGIKYRRRSWSCSETCSSFSESPSSSSSNSFKDPTSSFSGSNNSNLVWIDEGDLAAGVLGDAESSDPGNNNNKSLPGSSHSSFSKRKRFVALFNSFGKNRGSSSTTSSGQQEITKRKDSNKNKTKSQFYSTLDNTIPVLKTKKPNNKITSPSSPRTSGNPNMNNKQKVKSLSLPRFPIPSDVPSLSSLESYNFSPTSSFASNNEPEESSEDPGKPESQTITENTNTPPSSSGPSSLSTYDDILRELPSTERLRFYVAREILTSERTFVDVLNLLTVDFVHELEVAETNIGHPVIHPNDLNAILGGLPVLKKVNEELLSGLEERISNWKSNPKVSDIINKYGPFLKHYSSYIRDHQKNKKQFDLCKNKNPRFANIVRDFERSDRCKSLKLEHYMLKPIQRMPQYRLLLGDYLKHLDPEDSDYGDTLKAIAVVTDVAEHGNEAIRQQENTEQLILLQNRIPHTIILKADRRLVKEGELMKVCRKELQPRYFILMSDCLFCMNYMGGVTTGYSNELKLKYELPLTGMRVVISPKEDLPNEFTVTSVQRSFYLVAKTPKERDSWVRELDEAIKRNIKRRADVLPDIHKEMFQIGKVAPVWIPDRRVTMCQACTAEFTVTFRRHHCRACGKVVCGNCSGNEAPLQYKNNSSARVCDDCYTYLLEEFDKENLENTQETIATVRSRFRRITNISKRATKHKKSIPSRLEVNANSSGSALSGYLQWKEYRNKGWKRQWFVLMPDGVLYVYAASEDIAAIKSIPLLGYQVEYLNNSTGGGGEEAHEDKIFQLSHTNQDPFIFQTDSSCTAEKWMEAMRKATVLFESATTTTTINLETEENGIEESNNNHE